MRSHRIEAAGLGAAAATGRCRTDRRPHHRRRSSPPRRQLSPLSPSPPLRRQSPLPPSCHLTAAISASNRATHLWLLRPAPCAMGAPSAPPPRRADERRPLDICGSHVLRLIEDFRRLSKFGYTISRDLEKSEMQSREAVASRDRGRFSREKSEMQSRDLTTSRDRRRFSREKSEKNASATVCALCDRNGQSCTFSKARSPTPWPATTSH